LLPTATGGACVDSVSLGFGTVGLCPFAIEEKRQVNNMMKAHLFMMHRIGYRLF
jgi:hypothetical protein